MKRVMVFPASFGKYSSTADDLLAQAGLFVTKYAKAGMTEEEVTAALQGYDAVVLGLEPMTAQVMRACPQLKVVARFGVGMDNVDQAAAQELGIQLFNTPGANASAVADFAFGLMLVLARSIPTADRDLKAGAWKKYTGYPVYGTTVGIIGLGAIGKGVARRAKGFGMEILAYDIFWDEALVTELGIQKCPLEELYRRSDFITLHTALTPDTRDMIALPQLQQMKPTAFLINCARGGLVNEQDLYTALTTGLLAGAGIDAFCAEPPTGSPLLTLDQVICTPHIAGSSIDAIDTMAVMAAQRCIQSLQG